MILDNLEAIGQLVENPKKDIKPVIMVYIFGENYF